MRKGETENFIRDGMLLEVEIDVADDLTDGVILEIGRLEAKRLPLWGLCKDRR